MLPAGHFSEHQDAQFIAGIHESGTLGVVAGAHGIAAQVLFQNLRVQPLDAVRHGVALIGKALVAVQAPQFHPLAVQVQPACHELQGAETEADRFFVQHTGGQAAGAGPDELYREGVQGGVLDAPRVHAVQGAGDGQGKLPAVHRAAPGGAADLRLQRAAHRLAHRGGVDAEITLGPGLDEHIPQIGRFLDVQADGAIDAAVGQVVDLPAEGRNVQILAAVTAHGHHVFLAEVQGTGQIHRKGSIAAPMVEQPPPVAEHGGIVGHRPESEQDRAACPLPGRKEFLPVTAHPLIFVLAAVVVGQDFDRMRDAHRLQGQPGAVRAHQGRVECRGKQPAVVPVVVFHSLISVPCKITLLLIVAQTYERKKNLRAIWGDFKAFLAEKAAECLPE